MIKTNVVEMVPHDTCTGCCACHDICPVNAIAINPDEEGFLMPSLIKACIKCNKCADICPVLNNKKENTEMPICFAYRADNLTRLQSSSGGAFSSLAIKVLNEGGCVCGAAFNDDFKLRHTIVSSISEMEKLRGSKYLQSEMKYIYREIKNKLENGLVVLYTGCPCQVSALYNYLEKKYNNLYTIDILCHGVPSQDTFSRYINEISKEKIKDVQFRNKENGWTAEYITIFYKDGSKYNKCRADGDPYVTAFLHNLDLRKSCSDCKFSTFPRQGDISLGDFWGISKIDSSQTDGGGTSLVLLNNAHGIELFESVEKKSIQISEIPYEKYITTPNRFKKEYAANARREEFFELMKNNGFYSSVSSIIPIKNTKNTTRKKYNVGLVSNYLAGNFGGSITQFALYKTISDFGYSVLMIERPMSSPSKPDLNMLEKIYIEIPYHDCLSKIFLNKFEMQELNDLCDAFVIGSDQLFQYALYNAMDKVVNLDWVYSYKNKIAYAASFGHESIWGDPSIHGELGYHLNRFDAFSVREFSAVEICKKEYGIEAEWVLDPVFLCDTKHYYELISHSKRIIGPEIKISAYILDPTENKRNIIIKLENIFSFNSEIFSELGYSKNYIAPLNGLNVVKLKVEERLQSINNCELMVTDSFHGTCFAIIMRKQFISIVNHNRGAGRFKSLLSLLGLEDRLFEEYSDVSIIKDLPPINYDKVYDILNSEKEKCIVWLKNNLNLKKSKSCDEYDILMKYQHRQEKITKELLLLTNERYIFSNVDDIYRYLDILHDNREKLLVIISIKDTPGSCIDDIILEKLSNLGIKTNLKNQHQHSYIFISNESKVMYDQISTFNESIRYNGIIDGLKICVKSSSYKAENISSILIDGNEHSVNKRGLNIVAYDKKHKCVRDSVCFDTHSYNIACYR